MKLYPTEVNEAIRLHKDGNDLDAEKILRCYLTDKTQTIDALLWLARVATDDQDALTAAELAYRLDPRMRSRTALWRQCPEDQ